MGLYNMINQIYQVIVKYDERQVNYFSQGYAKAVTSACRGAVDYGSKYEGSTITEWATFENYYDALTCEQMLERIRNSGL